MLETKCVGDNSETLLMLFVFAIFVTTILCLSTLASCTNIAKMWSISKFCHHHKNNDINTKSPTSTCHLFLCSQRDRLHWCWRRNVLVTTMRCWWPIYYIEKTNITNDNQCIIKLPTHCCHQHHMYFISKFILDFPTLSFFKQNFPTKFSKIFVSLQKS